MHARRIRPVDPDRCAALVLLTCLPCLHGCAWDRLQQGTPRCPPPPAVAPAPPADPGCHNPALTSRGGLVVITPHPDDETLGFAGLIREYSVAGKPVSVTVVTDGDAFCEACTFWKNPSAGATSTTLCSADDLASFAAVRHQETIRALEHIGGPSPRFLGYPDTGIGVAWKTLQAGKGSSPLRRSDFSGCTSCGACGVGYGAGPATALTGETLRQQIKELIARSAADALVGTTHWLDGHPDHAALGKLVREVNAELPTPRAVAYSVIHAKTPLGYTHVDCWYPPPASVACNCAPTPGGCFDGSPGLIASSRSHRYRPTWPLTLPDDVDYGAASILCLSPEMYDGPNARKLLAVQSFRSQQGLVAAAGDVPEPLRGLVDCNGYQLAFVRKTEAYVLESPGSAGNVKNLGTHSSDSCLLYE